MTILYRVPQSLLFFSLADLKDARPTSLYNQNTISYVLGEVNETDGRGALYRWNETSTAADDGFQTITPNINPPMGRWVRLAGLETSYTPTVLDYGADPTGASDSTAAVLAALTANQHVYLNWRNGYSNYRVGDLSLSGLHGRKLWSRGAISYQTWFPNTPRIRKATGATSAIFDTQGVDCFTFEGFRIEGVDRSIPCIATGGDNITLRDMTCYMGKYGYGHDSRYGQTSQIFNSWFIDNKNGVKNIVDTTLVGGAIATNQEWGLYLGDGAEFNNINTRYEWNGFAQGTTEAYVASGNIRCEGSQKGNVLNGTVDAGNTTGLLLVDAVGVSGSLTMRRNGRQNVSSNQMDNAHIAQQGACNDINIDAVFIKDDGDLPSDTTVTPQYCYVMNRSVQPQNVNINGTWTGYTVQPMTVLNGNGLNLRTCLTGSGAPPVFDSTGSLAAAGSAVVTAYFPLNFNQNRRLTRTLKVTVRDNASDSNHYVAEFPVLVWRGTGTNNISFGTPSDKFGTAGYIRFGSGTIQLTLGTLSEANGFVVAPITVLNNAVGGVTVFLEIE